MRRHWKRLAKRASNAACDDQERTEALADALQRDWNLEVPAGLPRRLRDVLDDRQGDLLGDSAPERLEVLRGETANGPLASILLDCAAQAPHEGYRGESRRIVLPESGQGALGPALVPVGPTHADLRSHPSFTDRMETFVSALFGHAVCYEFPRLWRTKGETLAEFLEACPEDVKWVATRSCWQGARHVSVSGRRRQCGICAACLLRRMSVHAAGRSEAPESYVWEDLSADRFEDGAACAFSNRKPRGALHEYAIAGVLHLDHLANLRQSAEDAGPLRKQVFLLSRSLGLDERETEDRLERMLRRHEEEWRSFVESLGPRSFVAQWIGRGN